MIIFPAIDIRGGKCVRLEEGRFDRETVFAENPVDAARRWVEAGTQWLHIVDLDGARAGKPVNLPAISEIARSFDVKVQLGGGIRTLETAEQVLAAGVNRLILGSVAARSPELVEQLCSRYGEKIVIGIDSKTKHITQITETGKNGTQTKLTVNKFLTNQTLKPDTFIFDAKKYKSLGYIINN